MTRVLVTGGAGFIGSHLCEALLKEGLQVRVLDNFSVGRIENLAPMRDRLEITEGDVTSRHDVVRALAGCSHVVHLAAIASVVRSFHEPLLVHDSNILGTLMVFDEARKAGVERVVFASSCAVYGDCRGMPAFEISPPAPLSLYAFSKLLGERYGAWYFRRWRLPVTALRFFNVFGPRQDAASPYAGVIAKFADRMLRGERPVIFGDGLQARDFIYVSDVTGAVVKALGRSGGGGEVLNVGRGEARTVRELAKVLGEVVGTDLAPEHGPATPGDVRYSRADVRRLAERLGFRATVPFEEGLLRTVSWYRKERGGAS